MIRFKIVTNYIVCKFTNYVNKRLLGYILRYILLRIKLRRTLRTSGKGDRHTTSGTKMINPGFPVVDQDGLAKAPMPFLLNPVVCH